MLYEDKCAIRTKGNISNTRNQAKSKAKNSILVTTKNSCTPPWWCAPAIWTQMCQNWNDEKWVKKSTVASANRAAGTPKGSHTKGTCRGGTKSQLQYMAQHETTQSGSGPMNWKDLYLSLMANMPDASRVVDDYEKLMDEKYTQGGRTLIF